MDALRRDEVERARATPVAEKLAQALEMMSAGIRLKRTALRTRCPDASDDELERRLREWLEAGD